MATADGRLWRHRRVVGAPSIKKQRNKEIKSSTVDQHYFPITNLRNIFAGPSCAKIAIGQERSAQQNRVA
jgi:hypothetical protein